MDCTINHSMMSNLISKYLNKEIGKPEAIELLINGFVLEEVLTSNDELLMDSYFAIKHLTEVGFETTNAELLYLLNCFTGKISFSHDDKERFMISSGYKPATVTILEKQKPDIGVK